MSDIFREVEEDVRRERFEKLWKQYGDYIIAAVAVIILGVAGYKFWQHYEAQQQLKAATEFSAAMQLSTGGRTVQAAQAFSQIARKAPHGYAMTARLAEADALLASGKTADALALYMTIANKDKTELGDVARIRAAWAQADSAPKSQLQTLLAPMTDPNSPWRFMAREILAYSDFRDGRMGQARNEYQSLSAETDAPPSLRQRARAMATLIRTGGGANFGTVPPLTPPQGTVPSDQKGTSAQ